MKFLIRLLIISLMGYYLPYYLPWWSLMVVALAVGFFIPGNLFNVFNAGFLGGGFIWLWLSFKLDMQTNSILSEKIVQLFTFSDATLLLIVAGLIGALVGGFSAATGSSFRNIFIKKLKKSVYS